jgi:beta-glucosidase
MDFPQMGKDFLFGAASAAYQIEGAAREDGKGLSIWDEFAHKKGKVRNNQNADVACDHYHRYAEDVALMKEMGLRAYRFSISWPRVMPEGRGAVNEKGLDFYSRLVDELLKNNITPWPTLFHWDLPLALQKRYKGFAHRVTADLYADYIAVVVKKLGDRVKNWITINEPWEFSCFGHLIAKHAPGRMSFGAFFHVMHNLLLAHGKGMQVIRALAPDAKAGITISMTPVHPLTEKSGDAKAAMLANQFMNHISLGPLYKKAYPQPLWRRAWPFRPKILPGDMDLIAQPADFMGLNYYSTEQASRAFYVPVIQANITGADVPDAQYVDGNGEQRTSMGWKIRPEGLYECLDIIRREYGNPVVYITETGAAFDDAVSPDGRVHDGIRIDFLAKYLNEARRAMDDGSRLKGVFVWSLTDNFEWAAGFDKRFGLIHVDFSTQKRVIKDSGLWYRDLIRATG